MDYKYEVYHTYASVLLRSEILTQTVDQTVTVQMKMFRNIIFIRICIWKKVIRVLLKSSMRILIQSTTNRGEYLKTVLQ